MYSFLFLKQAKIPFPMKSREHWPDKFNACPRVPQLQATISQRYYNSTKRRTQEPSQKFNNYTDLKENLIILFPLLNYERFVEFEIMSNLRTSKWKVSFGHIAHLRTPSTHSSMKVKERVWSPSPHISNLSVEVRAFRQKAAGAFSLPPTTNIPKRQNY